MVQPVVIGIAGGSGSGKSSISDAVVARLEHRAAGAAAGAAVPLVSKITHDAYYRDLRHLTFDQRKEVNFDHPDALETELLIAHLRRLKAGHAVRMPCYDFSTHSRRSDVEVEVQPTPVIVLDGILIFADPELRSLIDIKVFVDTDSDIRFIRRLKRDTCERGRTAEDVAAQYLETVRPMHVQFVEPSKRHADIIIPEGGYDSYTAMDLLIAMMQSVVARALTGGAVVGAAPIGAGAAEAAAEAAAAAAAVAGAGALAGGAAAGAPAGGEAREAAAVAAALKAPAPGETSSRLLNPVVLKGRSPVN
jgi:uridine kinase